MEALWGIIEPQLSEPFSDTSLQIISLLVKGNCGDDFDCLYDSYDYIQWKLERRFDLPAAIAVCDMMVELAQKENEIDAEAEAHVDLHRFHDALGNSHVGISHIDKAEKLFRQSGNQSSLIRLRMKKLEKSLEHRAAAEVEPELEALLVEAKAIDDSSNVHRLHIRLILHYVREGKFGDAERHIKSLEAFPISSPVRQYQYKLLIYSTLGRADIAKAKGESEKAFQFYLKGLKHCEAEPSRWMEIRTLQNLATVEMERGNLAEAHPYLDRAEAKSMALELDDHLATTYGLKAWLAETEERYEDALAFSKKQEFHEEKFQNRGAGFDFQKHELTKEKERLAGEAARKEAELKAKDLQIKRLVTIVACVLLLVALLLLFRHRKVQNGITTQPQGTKNTRHPLTKEDETGKPGPTLPEPDRIWLHNFNDYLKENLSNENLTIPVIAMDFAMSESSLLRQVKRLTGMPPAKYLKEIRLEKGLEFLEQGKYESVAKVASKVGYHDVRSFSRGFKKKYGRLPSDFFNQ